jgi:hypothetical protein
MPLWRRGMPPWRRHMPLWRRHMPLWRRGMALGATWYGAAVAWYGAAAPSYAAAASLCGFASEPSAAAKVIALLRTHDARCASFSSPRNHSDSVCFAGPASRSSLVARTATGLDGPPVADRGW